MTARSQMKHRATVTRDQDTGSLNDSGQPIIEEIVVHDDLHCRVWSQESRLIVTETKIVSMGRHTMVVPRGTDMEEKNDVISDIRDRRGNKLFGKLKFRVDSLYYLNPKCIMVGLETAQ